MSNTMRNDSITGVISPPKPMSVEPRRWTVADVALFPNTLASVDVDYELDDGRIVVVAPPGGVHAFSRKKFLIQLSLQGEERGHGIALPEVGVILRTNPDRLVGPDAVFVTNRSLPLHYSPEGYLATIPELVVEVRSPNDSIPEVERKVQEYLDAGVIVIWVSDPARRTVTEYRQGTPARTYSAIDVLTVPDVIPGFQAIVANLF